MDGVVERVVKAIGENLPSPYELDIPWKIGALGETVFDVPCAMQSEEWVAVAKAAIKAMEPVLNGQSMVQYTGLNGSLAEAAAIRRDS
jgi:hypothetical protein